MNKLFCVLILCFASIILISGDNNGEVTETSKLTPFQQTQLEKFRTVVAGLLDDDYERSDTFLLGFLKSKKWQIFPARQMLKNAKIWKQTHKIKELGKSDFSQEMLTLFPIKLDGYDRSGCPLVQVHFGSWDVADYISKQEFARDGVHNFMKHFWQMMAKAEVINRNNFPKCHQSRAVVTLKNYNITHFADVHSISTVVRMITDYSNYAPSLMLVAHIVEVPDTIQPLLELLKTNINDELYKLFNIHKEEDWKQDLNKYIDINQISSK